MVLKKSFCLFSLQTGTIAIGIIGAIANAVFSIILTIQLSKIRHQHNYTGQAVFSVLASVFQTVISYILIIFNIGLFRGAYLERRPLVVAWLWCDVIATFGRDVFQVVQGFVLAMTYANSVIMLIYVIIIIVAIAFCAYCWWVVYSFSEELKLEEGHREASSFQVVAQI